MTLLAATSLPASASDRPERAKLAAAARQFEAIFVRQMLSSARKADFGEPLLGGQAMDTFRQLQDERFADLAAERGAFGIAKMLEQQLGTNPPRNGEGDHAQHGGGARAVGATSPVDTSQPVPLHHPLRGWSPSPFRGGA